MRVVFMGTPGVAVPVLSALLDGGFRVVGVYTRPDRRAGRGKLLVAPETKRFALERGLDVFQPASLRKSREARQGLASLAPDAIIVAAYGLFLPSDFLELPRLGCLNVHPSLLPRYRGPSPVASAILNGDEVTGVTIMRLDEGMDTGPILLQEETPVGAEETAEALTERLFRRGAGLIVDVLQKLERGDVGPTPQDGSDATVTRRLSKEDGEIDWGDDALRITRQVRAYHPWPGAYTRWRGKALKIVEASPADSRPNGAPTSEVVALPEGVGVVTGDGILVLRGVQLEGRRVVDAAEFVQGYPEFIGSRLGK